VGGKGLAQTCRRNTVRSPWLLTKTRSPSSDWNMLHHHNLAKERCSACVSIGDCSFNCRGRERTVWPSVSQAFFIQLAHLLLVDKVMCQKSTVMMVSYSTLPVVVYFVPNLIL